MKKFFLAVVVVLFVSFQCYAAWADNSQCSVIKREIISAMSEGRAINTTSINQEEFEKYFREVFSTEKNKIRWVNTILRQTEGAIHEKVEVYMNDPQLNLAPQPFIEIKFGDLVYTFFSSGALAYDIGGRNNSNFFR